MKIDGNNKLIGEYTLLNSHIKCDSKCYIQKGTLEISCSSKKRFLIDKIVLLCINFLLLIYFSLLVYFNKSLFEDKDYGIFLSISSIFLFSFLSFSFIYAIFYKRSFKNNKFNFFKSYSIDVNDDFLFLKIEDTLLGIFEKIYFYISFLSYILFFSIIYILVLAKKAFNGYDFVTCFIYLIGLLLFCFCHLELIRNKFDTFSFNYNDDTLVFNSNTNKFKLNNK